MGQVIWPAAPDGRYWIDVALGNEEVLCMVDTGLVDPLDRIGFELEPQLFDRLKTQKGVTAFQYRWRRDASGQTVRFECGLTQAQLTDPATRQRVGPIVPTYVCRGSAGVPIRVGAVFFHHLTGCKVKWDLAARVWCVDYP
jgi:hypothetical protein